MKILGIETSCDETGAAVFDTAVHKLLSHALFSQIDFHKKYGGVVPEVASRSQLEKIDIIVNETLSRACLSIDQIDAIAVTCKPGLVGSLLVGVCFAKGIAWSLNKKIMGIDHHEGHIFSVFLKPDGSVNKDIQFPFIALTVSGGHTSMHLVEGFGCYKPIGATLDDAAGEAFDKVAKMLGLGYPGGALIEKLASQVDFYDFFSFPRTKFTKDVLSFSFSGLKTAVLYTLVKQGAYDLHHGPIQSNITLELQQKIASSLLVCIGDIFVKAFEVAFKQYPNITSIGFAGGVACNKYLRNRLEALCFKHGKMFFAAPPIFCTDNGAMIAFVGGYKALQDKFSDITFDVMKSV